MLEWSTEIDEWKKTEIKHIHQIHIQRYRNDNFMRMRMRWWVGKRERAQRMLDRNKLNEAFK